jgi:predicted dehydrogenase
MVNWLVVGVGDIAQKRVIPAILAEPRSVLYGVVTRDARKAIPYPHVTAWTTLDAALQDGTIDAVYISSPVVLHAKYTLAALQAGKHVLCEKPVAMNLAQAERMVTASKLSGKLFGAAYYRRLFPKLIRAKELIAQGEIGQPVLAEANCHGWLESEERAWLRDPAMAGGGPLYDIGSHRIDTMNFLFGRPLRATGLLSNAVHSLQVEDSATVVTEYAGGMHGVVDVRWNSRIERDQFRVIGTEGEMNLDSLSGPQLRIAGHVEILPTHANVHFPLVENFVDAILDGASLVCTGAEAIWTDWVTEQVMHAARKTS